ncbi:uncharacterized protein LOC131952863 [Physella acuta]|uniref:uncharacterized protein LOC131952863 n=1 Tax=Physella acuta TaxID=109671 RepID=UPI0027DB6206|nr:uncharacterized protein LOC131952863 [Physella acuta]
MAAYELVLILIQAVLVLSTSRSHLTIRLYDPLQQLYIQDLQIEEKFETIIAKGVCQGPGNTMTFRLSPGDGGTDLLDENSAMTIQEEGAHSCIYTGPAVSCKYQHYCTTDNTCNITINSACPAFGSKSGFEMTESIDITIDGQDKELHFVHCIAVCQADVKPGSNKSQPKGLSELAIGFIVAGAMVGAALIVIGIIVWKIRQYKPPSEDHKQHHIDYAT